MRPHRLALLVPVAASLAVAVAPAAAAPPNDGRDDAAHLGHVPLSVDGTLRGARLQDGEQGSPCAPIGSSVYFRIDPKVSRRAVVRLRAKGDLDATLDVYERLRSRQRLLACDATDVHGQGAVGLSLRRNHSYLVRVSRRKGSFEGDFRLALEGAVGTPRLPGAPLPASGVSATLDRAQRTANAWSVALTAGTRYRVALRHPANQGCLRAAVLAPGATLRSEPVARLSCDGYALVTPDARHGGRYTVLVRATGARGPQRYHLAVGHAGPDDSAPGAAIKNYARVRNRLDGANLDQVDLFRFDVVKRSVLFLHLRAAARSAFDLVLLDETGRRLRCACNDTGDRLLHKGLRPGRFFVAVRSRDGASGGYSLLRASRTITQAHLTLASPLVVPGTPVQATVTTAPLVDGPVTVTFEQFDPLAGWQFSAAVRTRARAGTATASWTPPTVGRWRAVARFDGTRGQAPSRTGFSAFAVEGALGG